MNFGTGLKIAADIINLLKGIGIIDTDGNIRTPTEQEDLIIASRVIAILGNYHIDTPNKVDQIIALLPMILQLVGVK